TSSVSPGSSQTRSPLRRRAPLRPSETFLSVAIGSALAGRQIDGRLGLRDAVLVAADRHDARHFPRERTLLPRREELVSAAGQVEAMNFRGVRVSDDALGAAVARRFEVAGALDVDLTDDRVLAQVV